MGASGLCTNPTAKQFSENCKGLLVCRLIRNVIGGNCEENDSSNMTNIVYSRLKGALEELNNGPSNSDELLPQVPFPSELEDHPEDDSVPSKDLFNLDENDVLGIKDRNVARYLGNWACKKVKLGLKCHTCSELFDTSPKSEYPPEETMNRNRSSTGQSAFENPHPFSYGYTLNAEASRFFEHLVELFRDAVRQSLLLNGTNVSKNILETLRRNLIVMEWLASCTEKECMGKRKRIVWLIVVAKIFLLVKTKNENFKVIKCSKTTLEQLRHA